MKFICVELFFSGLLKSAAICKFVPILLKHDSNFQHVQLHDRLVTSVDREELCSFYFIITCEVAAQMSVTRSTEIIFGNSIYFPAVGN